MGQWYDESQLRFAVGIEDTFVPQTALGRRALDEYELTQHYQQWEADLALAASTGATMIRYGIPWYRVNPAPGRFEWGWLDRVADCLAEHGLEPIVDLMHYGTPTWLDNEFLNAGYASAVAEYAHAVASRYRGRWRCYTPLNEPLINAQFCGETGTWPPYLRGHDGFVKLVRALVRGIVSTQDAVSAATGGAATFVHVEASFRYVGAVSLFRSEVELLRERCFLVEDLLTGRVDDDHALAAYLRRHGFDDADFAWCLENTALPNVMGVNYYPHLTTAEYTVDGPLRPSRRRNDGVSGFVEIVQGFASRYGRPVFLTETSMTGTAEERLAWLDESVAACRRLLAEGVPVVGYTWWPLFDLVDWEYREGVGPVSEYLQSMGLWDLRPDEAEVLRRVPTAAVERFREHALGLVG